ncbi:hypothetical protein [Intrasporangium sp.]|uniref:hypothetical protein n=1 Tax=Intrasporangium sp. TaxID=1925024 RepID=UPI00293A56A4|nr:hypothetical protein [Intrasporangium sp.]MDV3220304.1 hypothetical protein [Intrasporangium sp.]
MRRRYLSLGLGELASAFLFLVVASNLTVTRLGAGRDALAVWSALVPLLVVLVQAGAYWLLARDWVGRAPMPAATARLYRTFRVGDVVLLAAGLVGVLTWWPERSGIGVLAVGIWFFGVVEYANYFVVRLSYPLRRWFASVTTWRTPRLVQDLAAAQR